LYTGKLLGCKKKRRVATQANRYSRIEPHFTTHIAILRPALNEPLPVELLMVYNLYS